MNEEKIFVYFAKTKGVKVVDKVTPGQVNDIIIKNLSDFEVDFSSGKSNSQQITKVKAVPIDVKGRVFLKKLGLDGIVNRKLKFDYTLADSLMFYVQFPKKGDYKLYAQLFDSIGKSLGLKAFDSFRGKGIIVSKKKIYITS